MKLFNSLFIYGRAEFLYLSDPHFSTKNFSEFLIDIQCSFWLYGKNVFNFSTFRQFLANLKYKSSLQSFNDFIFRVNSASL